MQCAHARHWLSSTGSAARHGESNPSQRCTTNAKAVATVLREHWALWAGARRLLLLVGDSVDRGLVQHYCNFTRGRTYAFPPLDGVQ